ncbi:TetR/AcrR family transcriptional regulator C-terminal domain-containing protein [Kitasatospora atroaurantiaca]|uniref:Tetracycline repressor-like protein n=1 Tax=Kitasatospora atroaurantiaca TaxID=285545 RepID=A0A561EKK2_9ACTN|nr:TetR/AcrR family transcriptional regulator C-terminal domain-containing protein [Kitasatospora atroaurantiaca]TWE16157.1 tetracycline repressor-like protein [Kitasatospora atroaurantiaca]
MSQKSHGEKLDPPASARGAVNSGMHGAAVAAAVVMAAAALTAAAMSLYRHVPGKEDLLTLMMDEALRYEPLPALPPGWRAGLESVARLQWDAYRKHPWLAEVMSFTRPVATPHAARHTERAMSAVDGLGLPLPEVVRIAVVLAAFVRGLAVNFEAEAEAELESGLTADQWMEAHGDTALSAVTQTDEFPMFQRLAGLPEIDLSLDTLFEFGLQRLLDGVGEFIAERTAAGGQ